MTDNTKPDSAGAAQDRSADRALVIERDFKATPKCEMEVRAGGDRRTAMLMPDGVRSLGIRCLSGNLAAKPPGHDIGLGTERRATGGKKLRPPALSASPVRFRGVGPAAPHSNSGDVC